MLRSVHVSWGPDVTVYCIQLLMLGSKFCSLSWVVNVAVDPVDELRHPGVHAGKVRSAAAWTPTYNSHQEPASTFRCLAGQRATRVPLHSKEKIKALKRQSRTFFNILTHIFTCGSHVEKIWDKLARTRQASRSPVATPAHSMRGETGPYALLHSLWLRTFTSAFCSTVGRTLSEEKEDTLTIAANAFITNGLKLH